MLALTVLGRGRLVADEHAAADAAGDESLVAQDADGLLDRHRCDAEELRQFTPGRELSAWLELAGEDCGAN